MYSVALFAMLSLLTTLLINRPVFDTTLLRVPGQMLQENADGTISNLYRMKVVNRNSKTLAYHLQLSHTHAKLEYVGHHLDSLKPGDFSEETFFIKLPKSEITERKQKIELKIMNGDKVIDRQKIIFIGQY